MAITKPKKIRRKITEGILYVTTTSNNTIITLTDYEGNKVFGGGTGLLKFKGAKQKTPYAAELTAKTILEDAKKAGLVSLVLVMKGVGLGREGVFKAINEVGGITIQKIKEATPLAHAGCRGPRPKRN
ncbi:MAG: 30S ribosomal protein S11 [Candidatus Absconditabacterales bacterium]|nr:30S ribosomal protein S11 [Candidatus Absconditabacterales bacterium]